jgi:hypothetical protein
MSIRSLVVVGALCLSGCTESLADSIASAAGTWHTPPIPSGGAIVLTLRSSGESITGEELTFGVMGVPGDSATIVGHYADGVYSFRMTYSGGSAATYSARVIGADTMSGMWTTPGSSSSLKLFRQSY